MEIRSYYWQAFPLNAKISTVVLNLMSHLDSEINRMAKFIWTPFKLVYISCYAIRIVQIVTDNTENQNKLADVNGRKFRTT